MDDIREMELSGRKCTMSYMEVYIVAPKIGTMMKICMLTVIY